MGMTSRAQQRVPRQQRLADLEASGITRAAYCAAQGIGYSTLQRRLHEGHFIGAAPGSETCTLSAEQFAWLCAGVDWRRLSQVPPRAVRI